MWFVVIHNMQRLATKGLKSFEVWLHWTSVKCIGASHFGLKHTNAALGAWCDVYKCNQIQGFARALNNFLDFIVKSPSRLWQWHSLPRFFGRCLPCNMSHEHVAQGCFRKLLAWYPIPTPLSFRWQCLKGKLIHLSEICAPRYGFDLARTYNICKGYYDPEVRKTGWTIQ